MIPFAILEVLISSLLCAFPKPASAAQGASTVLHVILGPSPSSPSTVLLEFERDDPAALQLLVTNVNLSNILPMPDLRPLGVIGDATLFTGWFLVQPNDRELWIGTRAAPGSKDARVSVTVSGVLQPVDDESVNRRYDLRVATGPSVFLDQLTSPQAISYAPVRRIVLELPRWARIDTEKTKELTPIGEKDDRVQYNLTFDAQQPRLFTIPIFESAGLFVSLVKGLPGFVGPLGTALVILIALSSYVLSHAAISPARYRVFLALICLVLLILLICLGYGVSWNKAALLIEGRHLFGVLTAVLLVALSPRAAVRICSAVLARMREPQAPELARTGQL